MLVFRGVNMQKMSMSISSKLYWFLANTSSKFPIWKGSNTINTQFLSPNQIFKNAKKLRRSLNPGYFGVKPGSCGLLTPAGGFSKLFSKHFGAPKRSTSIASFTLIFHRHATGPTFLGLKTHRLKGHIPRKETFESIPTIHFQVLLLLVSERVRVLFCWGKSEGCWHLVLFWGLRSYFA